MTYKLTGERAVGRPWSRCQGSLPSNRYRPGLNLAVCDDGLSSCVCVVRSAFQHRISRPNCNEIFVSSINKHQGKLIWEKNGTPTEVPVYHFIFVNFRDERTSQKNITLPFSSISLIYDVLNINIYILSLVKLVSPLANLGIQAGHLQSACCRLPPACFKVCVKWI